MLIKLDPHHRIPIYTQIVEQVTGQVTAGTLKPGEQLPTVRQLAHDLRVNFNTVARAYRLLHQARVISTQQGRGTYVAEPARAPEPKQARRAKLRDVTHRYLNELRHLGYTPTEVQKHLNLALAAWANDTDQPE